MMASVRRKADDRGAAMVIALVWSVVLSLIAGAVLTAVYRQIRPSDRTDRSYQALAAAEAGITDLRARLAANGTYWFDIERYYANPDAFAAVAADNPAIAGWASVPGGPSNGEFTYWIDTADAARSGRLLVSSTGRSVFAGQEVTRTIEAQLEKRTTAGYVYVSDSEAFPWNQPGLYLPGGEVGTSRDVIRQLCGDDGTGTQRRRWYDWINFPLGGATLPQGPATTVSRTDPTYATYGPHRNSQACVFGRFSPNDRWVGDMHTNDVWYIDPNVADCDPLQTGCAGQVFFGRITSSCPGQSPGVPANSTCRDEHRWISTGTIATNSLGDSTRYVTNEVGPTSEDNKKWNPEYASPLEMPSVPQTIRVRELAAEAGCVYRGPTRIRFTTVSGKGKMLVTSPSTTNTSDMCGGTSLRASDPNANPTLTLDVESMQRAGFNGVVAVEPVSTIDWPATNTSTTAPSCRVKSNGGPYPFIAPNTAIDPVTISSGSPLGYPSAATRWTGNPGPGGKIDTWTDHPFVRCGLGDLYVDARASNGGFTGSFTLYAEGDIVITDDIVEASVTDLNPTSSGWGIPSPLSTSRLGLVSGRYTYVYHLDPQAGGNNNGINQTLTDLLLNIVMLAPNQCLAVQDYKSIPQMGRIRIVGSIGQNTRCRLLGETGAGYSSLAVVYDDRLKKLGPPPYFSELSGEPWNVVNVNETVVRRDRVIKSESALPDVRANQAPGAVTVYDPAGPDGVLEYARVTSGQGSVRVVTSQGRRQLEFTAPQAAGVTAIDAVVRRDGNVVGRTLLVTTSGAS